MKKTFKMQDLGCANCAAKIESSIAKLSGVTAVSISFMSQKMVLEAADDRFDDILEQARTIARRIEPDVVIV